jgi:pyruvate dehydrogenase E2 component (dihydrolipoamide acetyltransferase)
MAEIIYMPKLSDTMTEGVVAEWTKNVGDKVSSGEVLAEIETDKATMEFESFYDGVLLHIGVEKGKAAPVNAILAIIGKEGEDVKAILAAENTAPAADAKAEVPATPSPEPVKETVAPAASAQTPVTATPVAAAPMSLIAIQMDVYSLLHWLKSLQKKKESIFRALQERVIVGEL